MSWVITHAKFLLDHRRHPRRRPHLATKAQGFGAAGQQPRNLGALLGAQLGLGARWRLAQKSGNALLPSALQPLADRAWRDAQRSGNGGLFPALLVQLPSSQAARLAPVVGLGCVRRFHAA